MRVYGGKPRAPSSEGTPLFAGLITSFLLVALWVLIVYVTHHRVGVAAWGVGGLLGVAVVKFARPPGTGTGVLAAILTLGTVVFAKVAVVVFVLQPIVLDEIVRDRAMMAVVYMLEMAQQRSFSPPLQADIDADPAALHDSSFVGRGAELRERMLSEAAERAQGASRAERERMVRGHMEIAMRQLGFGVLLLSVFGLFDLLWLGLGVSTAWKIGCGIG